MISSQTLPSTPPTTLDAWLALLEALSPEARMDRLALGLARMQKIKDRLGIRFSCPVIMVAGTNGKGSTCAMLESMYLQAGYRVGAYVKPHLVHFRERARLNGASVTDEQLMASFDAVERARRGGEKEGDGEDIPLTYFEFTTLAIVHALANLPLDVIILEVGLGGRLDAVNVFDADVAIVTSIDIDHAAQLGNTREKIAFEKAGIFRPGKTAICSDPVPPQSLIDHAHAIGADVWLMGRDFHYEATPQQWSFEARGQRRHALAYPSLRGANQLLNACAALTALTALSDRLPMPAQAIRSGLMKVNLPGRFQVLPGQPVCVLDVAHNPHAAATLAKNLDQMGFYPDTYAVFGCMADKDIQGIIAHMKGAIDHWYVTDLASKRAATTADLVAHLTQANIRSIDCFTTPREAYHRALQQANERDRIVVFGSFLTVGEVMR